MGPSHPGVEGTPLHSGIPQLHMSELDARARGSVNLRKRCGASACGLLIGPGTGPRKGAILGLTPFETPGILGALVAGWSSPVARRAHNPKVAGSNPAPAMVPGSAAAGGVSHVWWAAQASAWQSRGRQKTDGEPARTVVQFAPSGGRRTPVGRPEAVLRSSRPSHQGPGGFLCGQVAQLVEHTTENRGVGGSIPPLATGQVGRRRPIGLLGP